MKKITYFAAALAFFALTSVDAQAQSDKKKSKKKQATEQTGVEAETQAETTTQVGAEQVQTETQTQTATQVQAEAQDQNEKREAITQEELPDAVKQALTAEAFSSWKVTEVFRITPNANAAGANAQGTANQAEQAAQNSQAQAAQAGAPGQATKTVYEIFFTNEQQQDAKVRIDEQGNIIRDQK
jgi:hypothetical protein